MRSEFGARNGMCGARRLFVLAAVASACATSAALANGCGARTPLGSTDASDASAGGDSPFALTCPIIADPRGAFTLTSSTVQVFGNVASSGCAFGAAWIENRAGGLFVVAATMRPVNGVWAAASAVATIARGSIDLNSAIVGSDGAGAFVVAWTDAGSMWLRNMDADGTPRGAAIAAPAVGHEAYLQWLEPTPTRAYRIGFLDDSVSQFHYLPYFARVGADGSKLSGPRVLTTSETDVDVVGFAHNEDRDRNELVWVHRDDVNGTMTVNVTHFDDFGATIGDTLPLLTGESIQTSRHGVALRPANSYAKGDGAYFGVWQYKVGTVVEYAADLFTPFTRVPADGADRPALAFTRTGALGIVAASDAFSSQPTDLKLTIARFGTKASSRVVAPSEGQAYGYAIAGGERSLAIAWSASPGAGVKATIVTP